MDRQSMQSRALGSPSISVTRGAHVHFSAPDRSCSSGVKRVTMGSLFRTHWGPDPLPSPSHREVGSAEQGGGLSGKEKAWVQTGEGPRNLGDRRKPWIRRLQPGESPESEPFHADLCCKSI